jgi:hypothetical protein
MRSPNSVAASSADSPTNRTSGSSVASRYFKNGLVQGRQTALAAHLLHQSVQNQFRIHRGGSSRLQYPWVFNLPFSRSPTGLTNPIESSNGDRLNIGRPCLPEPVTPNLPMPACRRPVRLDVWQNPPTGSDRPQIS